MYRKSSKACKRSWLFADSQSDYLLEIYKWKKFLLAHRMLIQKIKLMSLSSLMYLSNVRHQRLKRNTNTLIISVQMKLQGKNCGSFKKAWILSQLSLIKSQIYLNFFQLSSLKIWLRLRFVPMFISKQMVWKLWNNDINRMWKIFNSGAEYGA